MKKSSIILAFLLSTVCLGYWQSDFSKDGIVNFIDFGIFSSQWLETADFNNLEIFVSQWLKESDEFKGTLVKPKFEFDIYSEELSVIRPSVGYEENDGNMVMVPPNTKRGTNVCLSSRPTLAGDLCNRRRCLDVDSAAGWILCSDDVDLYKTTLADFGDGSNPSYEKVIDVDVDQPFVKYRVAGEVIMSAKVMDDGSWIVSYGDEHSGTRSYLFRSTDLGNTWEVCKSNGIPFRMERGYVPRWGWMAVSGNEVVVGEYGYRFQYDNPRRIYYSDDYGATWTKIYQPDAQSGMHAHLAAFAPGDTSTVYISYGDGGYRRLVKLVHASGSKKDPNNWINNGAVVLMQPTSVCSDGRYLYFGKDGSSSEVPHIIRLDPVDDNLKSVLNIPARLDTFVTPYNLTNSDDVGDIFDIHRHEGMMYACMRGNTISGETSNQQINGGLYVSEDGCNWVCAYRMAHVGAGSICGIESIGGYAQDYLWGTIMYDKIPRLFKMKPVEVANTTALMTERGVKNLFTWDNSCIFGGGFGKTYQWATQVVGDYNAMTLSQSDGVTEPSLVGGYSLRISGVDNSALEGRIRGPYCSFTQNDVNKPVCASFWIKGASSWPVEFTTLADFYFCRINTKASNFEVVDDWQKVMVWGKVATPGSDTIRLRFITNGAPHVGAVCYVDAAQMVMFDDTYYSGTWQIGGTNRADEFGICALHDIGEQFTISFEWQPKAGHAEFARDLAIACLMGSDGSYLDLIWDQSENRFVLVDANGDTATSAKATYQFQHNDFARFAITSDGTDSILYIQDSLNGFEIVKPDTSDSVSLTGVPIAVKLGTNHAGNLCSSGCVSNVRVWDLPLGESDIIKVFDKVGGF
jgi:hypothetical protein